LGPRAVTLGGGGEYRPVGRRVFSTPTLCTDIADGVVGLKQRSLAASDPTA
jgi:hypothetical protein